MTRLLKNDEGVKAILDGNVVIKTVKGVNCSRFYDMIGPKEMIDREVRALKILEDVNGVQKLIRRVSDDTILTEYIPGASLRDWKGPLEDDYIKKLRIISEECFKRGVYRIGQTLKDFLIKYDGNPAIIDFGNVLFEDDYNETRGMIVAIKYFHEDKMKKLEKKFLHKHYRN